MERRRFVIGTAALGLGLTLAQVGFAQRAEGNISVHLDNARDLAGLSGNDLRLGLLRNLRLESDTRGVLPSQLFVLRLQGGRVADRFVSRRFEVAPGRMGLPGASHFPGEMGFPGEMTFPGEITFPGEMGLPDNPALITAERMAQETLRRARQDSGFFFVVFAPGQPVAGQGLGLPTVRT